MNYFLAIGPFQVLFLLTVFLLVLLFPLIALISVLKNQFDGNDKIVWVLLILIVRLMRVLPPRWHSLVLLLLFLKAVQFAHRSLTFPSKNRSGSVMLCIPDRCWMSISGISSITWAVIRKSTAS